MNPAAYSTADERLSSRADRSKKIQRGDDQDLEDKIKRRQKVVVGISPMILASASANLSSTESASEGDRCRTMARVDSAMERQPTRFWPARLMEASRSSLSIHLR